MRLRILASAVLTLVASSCASNEPVHTTRISTVAPSSQPAEAGTLPELIPASVVPPAPGWTEEVDFLALREAYGARADFEQRCEVREVAEGAATALVNENFEEVVSLTTAPLEQCPVWAQLHLWRAAALRRLGREQEARVHQQWFLGLTQSILDSGDGKATETPYVTISVPEEDAVLARLRLEKQSQVLTGSPMLDLITASDEEGNIVAIYFNPSWHFIRLLHRVSE